MIFLAIISFFAGIILLILVISKFKFLKAEYEEVSKQIRIPLYFSIFFIFLGIFMIFQSVQSQYKKYYWELEKDLIYQAETFCYNNKSTQNKTKDLDNQKFENQILYFKCNNKNYKAYKISQRKIIDNKQKTIIETKIIKDNHKSNVNNKSEKNY